MTGSGDLKFGMAEARNTPYLNNYILNDSATIWTLKKKKKKKKKKKTKKVDKFPPLLPLHLQCTLMYNIWPQICQFEKSMRN